MLMIIGARGWEHRHWDGTFYEKLLPPDWHLKFYSSNFDAALAPASFWLKCNKEEIEEFLDDIPDDYPLIFEMPGNLESELYLSVKDNIPNWVDFNEDVWSKTEDSYTLTQANIVSSNSLKDNCAVFKMSSKLRLKDVVLKEAMQTLKSEFKDYDTIYLFFDDTLIEVDIINTASVLLKMLALNA